MTENILFEGQERRIENINLSLKKHGFSSLLDAQKICNEKNVFPDKIIKSIQPIAFENAVWAYTLGCAIGLLMCILFEKLFKIIQKQKS